MSPSLAAAAAATLAASFAPNWTTFVALRALTWPCALWRSGGGDGLWSKRWIVPRSGSRWVFSRRRHAGRLGWALGDRGFRRGRRMARGRRSCSAHFAGCATGFAFALPRRGATAGKARALAFWTIRAHFSDPGPSVSCSQSASCSWGLGPPHYNYFWLSLKAPPFSLNPTTIGLVYCTLLLFVGAVALRH